MFIKSSETVKLMNWKKQFKLILKSFFIITNNMKKQA